MLIDRNNIIENHIKESNKEYLISLLDNYFENILQSDEKVIHTDLVKQIVDLEKYRVSSLIIKNLDNFLKQKKIAVRNNIKRNNFKIEDLLNISNSYGLKINNFISFLDACEKTNILKVSSLHFFDNIISDPSIILFLKTKLSNVLEEDNKNIRKLNDIILLIHKNNQELNSYKWFKMLFSTAIQDTVEQISAKSYPAIPVVQNDLINLINLLEYFNKLFNHLLCIKYEIDSIIKPSFPILTNALAIVFKNSSLKEILTILKNNNGILYKLFRYDFDISKEVVNLSNRFNKYNLETLKDFFECLSILVPLLHNNMNKEIVFKKINNLFENEEIFNFILDDISKIKNISKFLSTIKDKDKLIEHYNKNLVQRILHKPNIELEKHNYIILQDIFGDKLMFKTNKIICDVENTLNDLKNFHFIDIPELKNKNILNLVTTSYNWDFNQTEGFFNTEENVCQGNLFMLMHVYTTFYKQRYSDKRKINWYLHFGEIIFDYKNIEYKMMPLQFIVFEYVLKFKVVDKEELFKLDIFKNYNDKFKQSVISSLILGGILKLDKNQILLGKTPIIVDYIKLFFSTTNYDNTWEKKREEQFTLSRQDILKTNINHYVKITPMGKDDLFKIITDNLNIFTPDINMYENVLNSMYKDDYISIKNGIVTKILY